MNVEREAFVQFLWMGSLCSSKKKAVIPNLFRNLVQDPETILIENISGHGSG